MMHEQIGEDDIQGCIVGFCQPVEYVYCHNAGVPTDFVEAFECLWRDQIQLVQQSDMGVRPTGRPPLCQAEHQGAVPCAKFKQVARAESGSAAVQCMLHDRQGRHRAMDASQVLPGTLRTRILNCKAI